VVALAGPTAAGKTAAAIAIARRLGAQIVSVDSALVYRGMDIGTAKPSHEELAAVPHHLIDIRDPAQAYSAAEFAADALRIIRELRAQGTGVVLAGGTMLYFKALFEGLDAMPSADAQIRARIEDEARVAGWPALHAELMKADPVTAQRLAPNDSQRIQRALEVFRATGKPLSSFHAARRAPNDRAIVPDIFLSLEPTARAWLHERIAQRFDAMLAGGFLDEVKALRGRGDLSLALPSMRCVGYRQAWELMDAWEAGSPRRPFPLQELRNRAIFATRQLAKRQLTWLRSMPQRKVVACDAPDVQQALLALASQAPNSEKPR
jgi:tRNA dimethylallyltransferase